ncbi:MAG TPA: polyphenol oxidase family protein, partial [Terriglobia bacterium]|nr:polyphenol oxidase family protein [Terriglobia bacterium]
MLQVKRQDQITFLHSELLDRLPGIVHAFSTRRGERNDFSLGPANSPNPMVQMNRVRFVAAIGGIGWPIIKLKQVHSGIVVDVDDTSAAGEAVEGDAAVTQLAGVMLAVQTADCVPILISHTDGKSIAAVHAGWRGTAVQIAHTTVVRMIDKFHVDPKKLIASIGPHIGACCYEVGEDVAAQIEDDAAVIRGQRGQRGQTPRPRQPGAEGSDPSDPLSPQKPRLDLGTANRRQLMRAGIPESQI